MMFIQEQSASFENPIAPAAGESDIAVPPHQEDPAATDTPSPANNEVAPAPAAATAPVAPATASGDAVETVKPAPVKAAAAPKGPKRVKKAPERIEIPPPEMPRPAGLGRPLAPEELQMERDRIYARLTSIPNVTSRPSPSDYVVFEVNDPANVHKKLIALGVPMDVVQKYPKLPNGMRVFVRTAKMNEEFLRALEQAVR